MGLYSAKRRMAITITRSVYGCVHAEAVVAEAVVATKNLLMQFPRDQDNSRIIKHLTHLLPEIKIPSARASIIWVMVCWSAPGIAARPKMAKHGLTEHLLAREQSGRPRRWTGASALLSCI